MNGGGDRCEVEARSGVSAPSCVRTGAPPTAVNLADTPAGALRHFGPLSVARNLLGTDTVKTLFDSVDRMGASLTFHRERHSVLAGNLANVDTPGYRPLDLERPAASGAATGTGLALARTAPGHMTAGGAAGEATVIDAGSASVGADGNAVNLEREMAKVDANRVRYAAVTELVSRKLALLRYAAGGGNG